MEHAEARHADSRGISDPVFQMVYISAATKAFGEEDLTDLLRRAREKNSSLRISGMLVYHEGSFIQVLEGDEGVVQRLYRTIEKDARHANVKILFQGVVEGRSFEDWTMGFYRTWPDSTEATEGLNDFLPRGFRDATAKDPDLARRALLAFREGRWRQEVDS